MKLAAPAECQQEMNDIKLKGLTWRNRHLQFWSDAESKYQKDSFPKMYRAKIFGIPKTTPQNFLIQNMKLPEGASLIGRFTPLKNNSMFYSGVAFQDILVEEQAAEDALPKYSAEGSAKLITYDDDFKIRWIVPECHFCTKCKMNGYKFAAQT